jgi:basic amino acid/polyamine antiporter, APA family
MAVRAAHASHHPVLAYRRILVPLVAGDESETAMALAAELADDSARLTAVVVVEVPAELPLEAHMLEEEIEAKHVLEDARAIGNARGLHVRTQVLRARVAGEAIVEEANRTSADAIVLRAPREEGRGRKIFGRTVDYVLKHAACRVMVAAPPPACAKPIRLT